MGAGEKKSFKCEAEDRYVIIQLKGKERLTLCEVEVYGGMEPSLHIFLIMWCKHALVECSTHCEQ